VLGLVGGAPAQGWGETPPILRLAHINTLAKASVPADSESPGFWQDRTAPCKTELSEGHTSPMILTNCPVCAAPLPDTTAKQCSRCKTRYCGPACQKQHWEEGGHDKLCKKIKKAGGAEQYNANTKYAESVAVAAKACAEDTKGQTCYICLEAVHSRTGEGIVRGCACGDRDGVASGRTGVAHVSCLAEQAKILVAEADENNLGNTAWNERWDRWHTCGLCKQRYHGEVMCALGWACWKTYLGRPETDDARLLAMNLLGLGLQDAKHYKDALSVREAELSTMRRLGAPEQRMLSTLATIGTTYENLGQLEKGLGIEQQVYARHMELYGTEDERTLIEANNYADSLRGLQRFEEAKALMRKTIPVARRVLGENDNLTLMMRCIYASALYRAENATFDDVREAVATLDELARTTRRVFGGAHPLAVTVAEDLENVQGKLRKQEELEDMGISSLAHAKEMLDAMDAMTTGDNPGGA
jgi:hypothetical protein